MPPNNLQPNIPHPNEPVLEAMLVNADKNAKVTHDLAEKNLVQNARNGQALDHSVELSGRILDEMKKMPEVQKVEVTNPDPSAKDIFEKLSMIKGEPGKPGKPADEEKILETLTGRLPKKEEIKSEIVAEILPGIEAKIPKDTDIMARLIPEIEKLKPKDGDPGEDADPLEIADILKRDHQFQEAVKGRPGTPGKPGSPDTGEDIVRKHKELPLDKRINYDDLQGQPNLEGFIQRVNVKGGWKGPGYLEGLANVQITNPQVGDVLTFTASGIWVNAPQTGGGGTINPPEITLSASPSQVKEKGSTVSAVDLSALTVKGTNDITTVEFFRDAVLINSVVGPNPAGGTETYTDNTDVTINTDFTAQVGDGVTVEDSNTVSYVFVYPFFYGSASPGHTEANIEALTKLVATQSDKILTFNPTLQVFKFAYPKSYGLLDKILDDSLFNITSDFTIYTVSVTGLDGSPVDYYLYEYNNITTQVNFDITFEF